jgi:hypothetical protein
MKHEEYLGVGDLARAFGVATRTAAGWIDSGILPGVRLPCGRGRGARGDRRAHRDDAVRFAREVGMPHVEEALAGPRRAVLVWAGPGYAGAFAAGLPAGWSFAELPPYAAASAPGAAFVLGAGAGLSAARELALHLLGRADRPRVYVLAPDDISPADAEALRAAGAAVLAPDAPAAHAGEAARPRPVARKRRARAATPGPEGGVA